MFKNTKTRRRSVLKSVALASVSLAVIAGTAQAQTAARPLTPRYGNLRPFYGNIRPFYGNISPFSADIKPFYGNISPFYGNISPFWGNISPFSGDVQPFWGNLRPFDGPVGLAAGSTVPTYASTVQFWVDIKPKWDDATSYWQAMPASPTAANLDTLAAKIQTVINLTKSQFGPAINAKTGKSFANGFSKAILTRYGIDLANPSSLKTLTEADRAMFFLDWYDNAMNYAGVDHVDHWMGTVNWSPSLTQQQGYGGSTTIGLLDFTVVGDQDVLNNIVYYDGVSKFSNGHGAAVASLIVEEQDGVGVMGIAPKAKVVAYNPFDATGTAGWADIKTGIKALVSNKASIINMSLGVPGYTLHPDWNLVFTDSTVQPLVKNTVFVVAAGNEGTVQTQNVAWNTKNPYLILVGSVNLEQGISNFSNQPGTACLTISGTCNVGSKLQDRFIVAPGELILVSDDKGGVVRQSGTSFAAPLVSGAVALLHDRWPWLVNFPKETTDLILNTAKDLGAPGVDPVYGHGLLDVTASQSPLNFNNLTWYETLGSSLKSVQKATVVTTFIIENSTPVNTKGLYYTAYETIGATNRDFAIPLSQNMIGQSVTTANGSQEKFQQYLLSRMSSWVNTQSGGVSGALASIFGLPGLAEQKVANPWGLDMTVQTAPKAAIYGFVQEGLDYQSLVKVSTGAGVLGFGHGGGAQVLNGQTGFIASDHDPVRGGANPMLGLASGGSFANWSLPVTERLSLSAGVTHRDDRRDATLLIGIDQPASGAKRYEATAQHLAATYALVDGVSLSSSYTRLREANALLGTQSLNPGDFAKGSTTDGYSVGVDLRLSKTLSLTGSASRGVTRQGVAQAQNLGVGAGGITSSAYEVALTKANLLTSGDRARVSVAQPIYVERGTLDFSRVEVVDRQTGALGVVTQSVDLGRTSRPYAAEFLYGAPVMKGVGEVVLFGRAESPDTNHATGRYMVGSQFKVHF